jgi:hypothetical protein
VVVDLAVVVSLTTVELLLLLGDFAADEGAFGFGVVCGGGTGFLAKLLINSESSSEFDCLFSVDILFSLLSCIYFVK